ncbi:hypothetical protein B0J12DRAFT_737102 [Macrophomina phaseolina]|uniref:TLC domain-containing protein n=1 Tax=Macrophomina phaseolina TaxID=35725 RepID=A0ABQ8GMC3_9PEZI|nr:hypothetical protein B0J12DRAFT_737102 [Macrophomina phaseolina]
MAHHVDEDRPHFERLVNDGVSKLAPYAGLILTVSLVVIFLFRAYIFEAFLLERAYSSKYKDMEESVRRGFVNHHIAGTIKIFILIVAIYPMVAIAFGSSTLHSSFAGHGSVTKGDVLLCCSELFIGMYIFELYYRTKISPIGVLHHLGTVLIAQAAVAISFDFHHETDATIEFILCLVWGAFDLMAEFLPHVAIILYRIYPERHAFLAMVFRVGCITVVAGTTAETAVIMWLFGSLWSRWTLVFKVMTPILHVIFTAAQLWGAIVFYRMRKRQLKQIGEEDGLSTAQV